MFPRPLCISPIFFFNGRNFVRYGSQDSAFNRVHHLKKGFILWQQEEVRRPYSRTIDTSIWLGSRFLRETGHRWSPIRQPLLLVPTRTDRQSNCATLFVIGLTIGSSCARAMEQFRDLLLQDTAMTLDSRYG